MKWELYDSDYRARRSIGNILHLRADVNVANPLALTYGVKVENATLNTLGVDEGFATLTEAMTRGDEIARQVLSDALSEV